MNLEAGFIGLGAMGLPIASNLHGAGVKLRVFNRTPSKAQSLLAKGAVATVSARRSRGARRRGHDDACGRRCRRKHGAGRGRAGGAARPGRDSRFDEHDCASHRAPPGALSHGARQHLRGVAGLRPARCGGGATACHLHLGTSGGKGKSASAARNRRADAFRLWGGSGGGQRRETGGKFSDCGGARSDGRGFHDGRAKWRRPATGCRDAGADAVRLSDLSALWRDGRGETRIPPPASSCRWVSKTSNWC